VNTLLAADGIAKCSAPRGSRGIHFGRRGAGGLFRPEGWGRTLVKSSRPLSPDAARRFDGKEITAALDARYRLGIARTFQIRTVPPLVREAVRVALAVNPGKEGRAESGGCGGR